MWLAAAPSLAEAGQGRASAGSEAIRALLTDAGPPFAPGCVTGTFRDGAMTAMVAQGYADIPAQRALDGDTLFYAASLSKQFTDLAVARLVVEGKLALDEDVRRYLPELPVYRAPVTVAMLMQHTAGIRDSLGLVRMAGMADVGQAPKEAALALVLRQRDTQFVPGTAYSYSNGGYFLLAEIVERVTGEPFAAYAKRTILDPMGMTRSYFLSGSDPRPGTFAHGYLPAGNGFVQRDTFPRFSGSGGLMLSMNDLARYEYDIERGRRVWTDAVARIMLTPGHYSNGTPVDDGEGLGYGGGLHIGTIDGQAVVQHTGSAEALKHAYIRLPQTREAFALLCNRGDWTASARLKQVMAAQGVRYPGMPRVQPAGLFHSDELGASYRLTPEGAGLRVEVTSGFLEVPAVFTFRPDDDGLFHHDGVTIALTDDPDRIVVSRGAIKGIVFSRSKEGKRK